MLHCCFYTLTKYFADCLAFGDPTSCIIEGLFGRFQEAESVVADRWYMIDLSKGGMLC